MQQRALATARLQTLPLSRDMRLATVPSVRQRRRRAGHHGEAATSFDLSLLLNLAPIAVMLFCLQQVLSLLSGVPGGVVGRQRRCLSLLVVLLAVGYVLTPFFDMIAQSTIRLIVSPIFLFDAVYALNTARLAYSVIRELAGCRDDWRRDLAPA